MCMCSGESLDVGDGLENTPVNVDWTVSVCAICTVGGVQQSNVSWSGSSALGNFSISPDSDAKGSLNVTTGRDGLLMMCNVTRYIPPGSGGLSLTYTTNVTEFIYLSRNNTAKLCRISVLKL